MPAVIPIIMAAVQYGVPAAAAYYGAKAMAGATETGANIQAQSADRARQSQDEASRRSEAFLRQQAEAKYQDDERVARANYELNAARERRLGSIGELLGFGSREIPDYVPGHDPDFTGSGGNTTGGPTTSQGTSRFSGEDAQLGEWLRSGMDPAAAIQKFNQQFGRTTGNEATFSHDNTIAVPSGYYATGAEGWKFAPGDHAGGVGRSATMPSVGALLTQQRSYGLPFQQQPTSSWQLDPYGVGSVGRYLGVR